MSHCGPWTEARTDIGLFHFLSIQRYGRQFSKFDLGLEFEGVMPKMAHRKTTFQV